MARTEALQRSKREQSVVFAISTTAYAPTARQSNCALVRACAADAAWHGAAGRKEWKPDLAGESALQ
jgi:hypothetical protein